MWLEELFELNKKLDLEFITKYQSNESHMKDKNILSLLVEIGELANEVRCFKYWSSKPRSSDKIVLEEYADVLIMILTLCNYLNVDIRYTFSDLKLRTLDEQFINLYSLVTKLNDNYNSDTILNILGVTLSLGFSLGYNEQDIKNACLKKMNIINERLNSDY